MKRKIVLLVITIVLNVNYLFPQEYRKISVSEVSLDTTSLFASLLDTIEILNFNCVRSCNTNYIDIECFLPEMAWDTAYMFRIIESPCALTDSSIEGISYFKEKIILWHNYIPSPLFCHKTVNQLEIELPFFDKNEPIRDNIPEIFCCYFYGQLFISRIDFCLNFNQITKEFPIVIKNNNSR